MTRQSAKKPWVLLIALALTVRALMPSGWMPVASTHGPVISPCSGHGVVDLSVVASGKHHKPSPHKSEKNDRACAFFGLAFAADWGGQPPILSTFHNPEEAISVSHLIASIGRGLAAPPPPSTGPPSLI
jgi:hypothetical protein